MVDNGGGGGGPKGTGHDGKWGDKGKQDHGWLSVLKQGIVLDAGVKWQSMCG